MLIYLEVTYIGYTSIVKGTLEIGRKEYAGGHVTQYFEWRGGNASSDGGLWSWIHDQHGFVAMELTSNATQKTVGWVRGYTWQKDPLPPLAPWFRNGSTGDFIYVDPVGNQLTCGWSSTVKN